MNSIRKPSVFGKSISLTYNDRRNERDKPGPPTHLDCGPGGRSNEEIGRTRKGITNNGHDDLHDFTIMERPKEDTTGTDFGVGDVFNVVKSLDANRYATKKTIAQGMLDIALLTANASQLKYILQVGKQHEFYTLMLTLICVSIGLQALVGILFIIVGGLNINRRRDHRAAEIINDVILIGVFVISLTNIIISGFGMEFSNKPPEFLALRKDILQGIIFVLLGSSFNINKKQDQSKANIWNNISVALMILTVAVNVVISAFEMRSDYSLIQKGKFGQDSAMTETPGIR